MAYQINRFNQTFLTSVEDGTIDTSTDLKFVGRNYAGYGEIHNENFLYLLENFSSPTEPPNKIKGQIWFDSSTNKLKFYDGNAWRSAGGSEVTESRPTGLTEGDFWWDSANNQLFAFDGAGFVLVGPQNVGEGITGTQERTVLDTTNTAKQVVASVVNGKVVAIFSDEEFEILNQPNNIIDGFDRVKRGITLINTNQLGVTSTDHRFWGTASNSERLAGFSSEDFVKTGSASFETQVNFTDNGFVLGDSNDLRVYVASEQGSKTVFENQLDGELYFNTGSRNTFIISDEKLLPGLVDILADENNLTYRHIDIGDNDKRFKTVFADLFDGVSTVSQSVQDSQQVARSLSKTEESNTIALRDSAGDLRANLFVGTALTAKYADLAEKYTTETDLPTGTIVKICSHESHEICPANSSDEIVGIISKNPAYLMNSELNGQPVALVGRVPTRVKGLVNKGEVLRCDFNGIASVSSKGSKVGIALENKSEKEESLIEVYLKI
jgi:hypothetical protein